MGMRQYIALARSLPLLVVTVALGSTACELMPIFQERPPEPCTLDTTRWGEPCGPCLAGVELFRCGTDRRWHREGECQPSPYDLDGDGFANEFCLVNEVLDNSCCGVLDCDDTTVDRFPGALADLDNDGRYDDRCCSPTDHEDCVDCDDDDGHRWAGHADLDGDGYHDVKCGGEDCDDDDELRWIGNADLDGDGHVDARCCTEDTPLCDDCDDDDPLRWGGHADLDDDGHDSVGCGGDDCDDEHPSRWIGHADADGDGHQDDRCCAVGSNLTCDDCNDNDPLRWTGNTDVDGDGHNYIQCRCDADELGESHCDTFDDCDDDCAACAPGEAMSYGSGLDHNCDGFIDDLQIPGRDGDEQGTPEFISAVDTGDSWSVAVVGTRAYVGTDDRLYEVDVADPDSLEIVSFVSTGAVRDLAIWRDLVLAATDEGLVVVRRIRPGEGAAQLSMLSRLVETGHSRGVVTSQGYAFVAGYEALFVADLSVPESPVVISTVGEPFIHDVRDVSVRYDEGIHENTILVLSGWTASYPTGGLTTMNTDALCGYESQPGERVISQSPMEGAHRIEAPCAHGFSLIALHDRLSFHVGGAELFGYSLPGGARPAGIFGACVPGDIVSRFWSYVVADDGLYWTYGATEFEEDNYFDTGHSRAVAVSGDHIYVATTEGLKTLEF